MRRCVKLTIEEAPPEGAILIAPKPFGHWGEVFEGVEVDGGPPPEPIRATNSPQEAWILPPGTRTLAYTLREAPAEAPGWVWEDTGTRYTVADPGLAALARAVTDAAPDPAGKLAALTAHAAEMFDYDHPEERFTDGHAHVPTLCGTTKGSCVDINTYVLAAARAAGLKGQYLTGYWFGPDRTETPDMHCWLAFEIDGAPQFWDVAHHLKWGVEGFGPGLNPAGGRRVGMACGRGLAYRTPNGVTDLSHFGEPEWVSPGGATRKARIRIQLEETET